MDTDLNAINEEQLLTEESQETDDSCRVDFIEIVPLARDTDGSCTTECVSVEDWSAEFKQENLAVVKQEPDDICCVICFVFSISVFRTDSIVQILGKRPGF